MKRDVFDGLKIEGLMDALSIPRYAAAGILTGLWKTTEKFYPRGDIGRATNKQIAERLDWPQKKADKLIEALIASRWMDPLPGPERLYIHDWHEHCEDSVHRVLARKHLFFANGFEPKLNRLEKLEREECERWYGNKRLTPEMCAQSAHGVRPTDTDTDTDTDTLADTDTDTPRGGSSALGSVSADSVSDSARPGPDPATTAGTGSRGKIAPGASCEAKPTTGMSHISDTLKAFEADDAEEARREFMNQLWSRIRKATRDSRPYMAWWASALPTIVECTPVYEVLIEAINYAESCNDEDTRAAKGLGPLQKPGAYVISKVLAATKPNAVRLPQLPGK